MNRPTVAKLAFGGAGIAVFGLGIHENSQPLRWIGIGLVAIAWLLRFWKEPGPTTPT